VLYYARRYKDAREELKKAIDGVDSLSAKAAYFVADSYYQAGEYSTALKEYESVVRRYPRSEYAENAQYRIALCHWKEGREDTSNVLLAGFAAAYPESKLADDAKFQIAERFREKEQYRAAADAYRKVVEKYPASDSADEALWNMGWCYIKLRDNERSGQAFHRLVSEYPYSQLIGSARFWAGVSYENTEKWQAAVDMYKETMRNKDWYYFGRAKNRLESLAERGKISKEMASIQYERAEFDESLPSWQNVEKSTPAWVKELLNLGIYDDIVDVFVAAEETGMLLEPAFYNLSVCCEKLGEFRRSWVYAWKFSQLPGVRGNDGALPHQIYLRLYPLFFKNAVLIHSDANNLDPLLVLALILEESRCDPMAISRSGARGLMQIMPSTGRDIARRTGVNRFRTEMLFHPETNIKMGTWYLSSLANRLNEWVRQLFAGRKVAHNPDLARILAVGAYNGGETRIRNWIEENGVEDIDEFVESIPVRETKYYIKKVCDSYEMYKSLYCVVVKNKA